MAELISWRRVVLAATVALALVAAGCGDDDSDAGGTDDTTSTTEAGNDALDTLVEAAREDGELNLNWGMSNSDTLDPLTEAFNEAYGLDIDFTVTPNENMPGNLITLIQESDAGRPASTDAYVGVQSHLLQGGPDGADIFEEVDWESFAPHTEGLHDANGAGLSLLSQILGFSYNTETFDEADLPTEVADVVDIDEPIASTPYAAGFDVLGAEELLGIEGVKEHVEALEPAGYIGCGDLDRVGTGEYAALWISCGHNIADITADKGAPVGHVVLDGAAVTQPWYMAVPKHSEHPDAAKLWLSWLVTPEAQAILYENEFADNRLIEGSHAAELIAEYEADGVEFVHNDYEFVLAHPELSEPAYVGELIGILTGR